MLVPLAVPSALLPPGGNVGRIVVQAASSEVVEHGRRERGLSPSGPRVGPPMGHFARRASAKRPKQLG